MPLENKNICLDEQGTRLLRIRIKPTRKKWSQTMLNFLQASRREEARDDLFALGRFIFPSATGASAARAASATSAAWPAAAESLKQTFLRFFPLLS